MAVSPLQIKLEGKNCCGRCRDWTQDNAMRGSKEEEIKRTTKTRDKNKQIGFYCWRELREKTG